MIEFSKLFPWKRRPKIIKTKIVDPKIGLSDEMIKELAEEMRIRHVYTVLKDRFERTVHTIVESFTPGSFDDAYLGHESLILRIRSDKSCDEVPGELYGSYGTDLYESQWTSKHGFLSKSRKEDLL